MKVIRGVLGAFVAVLAALAGNWVGDALHTVFTGQEAHRFRLFQTDEEGAVTVALNPLLTHLIPALLAAALWRPRWLWAFITGMVASALMGDCCEETLYAFFDRG